MDSLPEEILIGVMDKLDPKSDMSTILSLRGVSRKWCRVASPYVHIAVQNYQPRAATTFWNFHRSTDLLCYLCWKLAQKPHLSHFVKEVASRPWKDTRWKSAVTRADLCARYREALAGAGPGVPDDVKDAIVAEMLYDIGDALLAFVLILCTDIEILMIPALDRGCGPRTRQVLRCAHEQLENPLRDGPEAMLSALRHVQLGDYVNGLGLADALDLLALPKLQHLELGNLGDTTVDGSQPFPPFPEHPKSYLRNRGPVDITLESCRLSSRGLTTLLAACGNTRSLFVKMRAGNARPSRAPCFAEPLERYGQSLEFLYLDTTAFEEGLAALEFNPNLNPNPNSNSNSNPGSESSLSPSARLLRAISSLNTNLRFLALPRADFETPEVLGDALPASLRELLVLDEDAELDLEEDEDEDEDGDGDGYRALGRGLVAPALERVACQLAARHADISGIYDGCLRDRKLPGTWVLRRYSCTVLVMK
ncbi:uncharacterized protein F4812DRAFT_418885 [Daldinia caldariorum]|uniref:uncharacterized protein n=1 Tax=Daldinia caldariorum TaxID=326644 RepID=UPI0020086168|nr:uncharacterized protein F4812DRAFT_418885 [Daldinia caldariorum]KAI1470757.1 hypothetical protein F4812DRAFT_418885 [Daldinia caldariorum]